jgi:hypothetical protein
MKRNCNEKTNIIKKDYEPLNRYNNDLPRLYPAFAWEEQFMKLPV